MNGSRPARLVVAVAALAVALGAAAPATADPVVTPDDVHRALGIDNVAADYVFLVDISGSMHGPRYQAVRNALRSFLASVAPQDEISLVTFAGDATLVAQQPAGRTPATIVDKLPPDATGDNTDIGKALEKAVQILGRPGAPSIGTVVLFTDGQHQPRADSPYPFTSGYAWDQLRHEADGLHKTVLTAFAIPLAGVTGAPLLGKIFPSATILPNESIDQVSTLLTKPKQVVEAAKTAQIMAGDRTSAITVSWPANVSDLGRDANALTLTLHATSSHMPLSLTGITVTADDPRLRATVGQSAITLPPGQSAPLRVTVSWDPGARSWQPLNSASIHSGLTLNGTVSTPWAQALDSDGITVAPVLTGARTTVEGSAQNGQLTAWLAATVILIALALLGGFGIRRRREPGLAGVLSADGAPRSMPLQGRRATISHATLGIGGHGTVRSRRDGLLAQTRLEIAYSRDGHPDHEEVRLASPGEPVSVSGVEFEWRPR